MNIGPKLKNDNLVFGYDTGYGVADNGVETRFYKGEPTTNILPSPEKNGRFTTDNQWGSYNTNQYNSNTYFSIGTVSGVSDNIVTLSSVGRTIRSFDVLRAQTTGGGITAGTDYVVKKLSSSTFSLHAYNNSQDGSQGYINPSTGFFKVHDAYANDTRVSINATSFPTMWWGAPHLPNSGLIKEIVTNGGYVKGTNCMRFHIYRGDSVSDGMAYNVYTPVTQGDVITVSYWVRPVNSFAHGKTWNYQTYFGGNSASSFNTTLNSTGEWQHVEHQWTASVTYNFYSYWFPSGSTDKWAMDMADVQVEVNKGHATPFTLTSRSNTASLIDLKKTADVDLSNVSFDSTAQPTFDGTDDWLNVPVTLNAGDFTYETVMKQPGNASNVIFTAGTGDPSSGGTYIQAYVNSSGGKVNLYAPVGGSGWQYGTYDNTGNFTSTANTWYHIVVANFGTTWKIYVNGNLVGDIDSFKPNVGNKVGVARSAMQSENNVESQVSLVKIYNTALTAEEIKNNFNAYKNRFDL